jgi:hypothetical protein
MAAGRSADASVAQQANDEMAFPAWPKSGFPVQWARGLGLISGQGTS